MKSTVYLVRMSGRGPWLKHRATSPEDAALMCVEDAIVGQARTHRVEVSDPDARENTAFQFSESYALTRSQVLPNED